LSESLEARLTTAFFENGLDAFRFRRKQITLQLRQIKLSSFRVTFPNAETFPYICALHDDLGMVRQVTVTVPKRIVL
jgi:plastocyanin